MEQQSTNISTGGAIQAGWRQKKGSHIRYYCSPLTTNEKKQVTVAIIADGHGKNGLGAQAAQLSIDTVVDYLSNASYPSPVIGLQKAIQIANRRVIEFGEMKNGKATVSIAVAIVDGGLIYVANVGNCRVYLCQEDRIRQITLDHTWALEQIRSGNLTPQEALADPKANILARALGADRQVDVDLGLYLQGGKESSEQAFEQQGYRLQPNEGLLLCSRALRLRDDKKGTFYISLDELKDVVLKADPQTATQQIIAKFNKKKIPEEVGIAILKHTSASAAVGTKSEKKKVNWLYIFIPVLLIVCALLALGGFLLFGNQFSSILSPGQTYNSTVIEGNPEYYNQGKLEGRLAPGDNILFAPGSQISTGLQHVTVKLPSGDRIYLLGNKDSISSVEFNEYVSEGTQTTTRLIFHEGSMFLQTDQILASPLTIIQTTLGEIRSSRGMLGVRADIQSGEIVIDCVFGECELVARDGTRLKLKGGEQSRFLPDGSIQIPPGKMQLALYPPYQILKDVISSTSTSTATQTNPPATPQPTSETGAATPSPTASPSATPSATPLFTPNPTVDRSPPDDGWFPWEPPWWWPFP